MRTLAIWTQPMLELLRRGATSKIAALILFLPLIFAFALWGIGPEWRSGGSTWLAKVGDTAIYPEEFQRAYQNEIDQISRQVGRRITAEQARYFGIDQRVLSQLSGSAALDQETRALGLGVSTKAIIDSVQADPAFAEIDGKFSKQRFQQALQQNGLTEAGYFALRKKSDVREQLTDSILGGVVPAQTYIDVLHAYNEEQRVIEHVVLDPAKVVKLAEPDEAKLKEYYEVNKRQFVAPETRKAGMLLVTRDAVKARITITPEEIKEAYEQTKDRYDIPETRHVLQMAFPDKAAAEKALPELVKAKNFVEAAVKLGAKESDLDLGTKTKKQMIDAKIADAVFALKKDEVSKVVEGVFATVIAKVTEITPGKKKTLDDVSADVKDTLQIQRASREIQALQTQVEDERSAGKSLADAAQKVAVPFIEIASIDRNGNGPDGKPAIAHPDAAALTTAIFASAVGLDAEPVDLSDSGIGWVNVIAITPEKERPFDEVKAAVKTAWIDSETRKELGAVAARFVERAIKGEPMATLAADAGAKLEKTNAITRTTSPPGLTPSAVQQGFALPKGGASSALTADGKARTLLRVAEVTPAPALTKEQADKLKADLTRTMQADTLNAFVAGLQARAGASVNQELLKQVLGGTAPTQ
jgi:peptidyl-prolyl cis-trans isomerase D